MRVLGIDPGLQITGYGCVEGDALRPRIVEAGVVRLTKSGEPRTVGDRLVELDRDVREIIERTSPDTLALEGLFAHYRHPETAIKMAHARGVIVLAARSAGLGLVELKPAEVKKATCGTGRATKAQMQSAVQDLFRLPELPTPSDLADALAIGVCALRREEVGRFTAHGVGSVIESKHE